MKRVLLIVAVLFGMALAAAPPAQAGQRRGHCAKPAYMRYYNPYYYGPYGPPTSSYYASYPGTPGYGEYPGWPGGVSVW